MKDLKQLHTLKQKRKEEISLINTQLSQLQKDKKSRQQCLKEIDDRIEESLKEVVITEHAIVRYFERVLGYNLEEIKDRILPPEEKQVIKQLNNCTYPRDGFSLIIKNNKVITIEIKKKNKNLWKL